MNTLQISKWLKTRKHRFPVIAEEITVSIPTLYSMADFPDMKRQKRIIDAVSNYIAAQPKGSK